MTFEELAKLIAEKIEEEVKEYDYESFAEMKQRNMWNSKDIKDEEFAYNLKVIAKETGEKVFLS